MNWQNMMKKKLSDLDNYTRDLEEKLAVAKDRLVTIAAGMHYSSEVQPFWDNDTKLKHTAAVGLKKLSDMRQREKPFV